MGKYNLNVRISEEERQMLDEYCQQVQRTQSDVVREFIRSLSKKLKKNRDVE
jgi:predicted DNA-binding protein